MWEFEHKAKTEGFKFVAGVDEAGRGPLAGPVVSAAVILPEDFSIEGIDDSKKLSKKKREKLFPLIQDNALAVATGICSHTEIDEINILQASRLSMKRAVESLAVTPDFLLIDGKFGIDTTISQAPLIKGDSRSISIAAASIIAKVTRDEIMRGLHEQYPQYNFIQHQGYPTKAHKAAVIQYGPSPVHRRSFKGVKEVIHAEK